MSALLRAGRLATRLAGAVLRPRRLSHLVIFLTDECNAKCPFCFNVRLAHLRAPAAKPAGAPMTLVEYEALASRCRPLTQLVISGGEPFLRDDIDAIVRAFYERAGAAVVSLPTNGSLPDRALRKSGSIAASCPLATVNAIVSLDAAGEEHDRLRRLPGGYVKAVGLCRELIRLRSSRPNLNVIVTTAVTEANLDGALRLRRELLRVLPSSGWHHNFQYDQRLGALLARDPRSSAKLEELERAFLPPPGSSLWTRLLARWYVGFTNRLIRRQLEAGRMLYRCVGGGRLAVVMPDGRLHPCEPFAFEPAYSRFAPPSLRDHGFDPDRARSEEAFRKAEGFIAQGRCEACPWTCAATASVAGEPSNWPLLWAELRGAL